MAKRFERFCGQKWTKCVSIQYLHYIGTRNILSATEQPVSKNNHRTTTETKFIDCVPSLEKEKFKCAVVEFFKFYSSQYQIKNHVISVNIGRWKNRIIENKQSNLTPEEERYKLLLFLHAVHEFNHNSYLLLSSLQCQQ